jgi:ethanolamine ammonia-lyase small subunit
VTADAWQTLRSHTAARIALGRAGSSLPTAEVLNFAMAHAAARDAVHAPFNSSQVIAAATELNLSVIQVHSSAADRASFLHRPDLGRRLDEFSQQSLTPGEYDVSIVVADGLSPMAIECHAASLLRELIPSLRRSGLRLAPLVIVEQGRVAIQDEIGQRLGATASVILIGERPGLGSADSLGAYLVFDPRPGNTDANRNCISNIRPDGLSIPAAAELIRFLLTESLRRKISGIQLKDDRHPTLLT